MDRTVSPEIAKKLQEAGWEKRTYFYWASGGWKDNNDRCVLCPHDDYDFPSCYETYIKSPQLHEILEELPGYIDTDIDRYYLEIGKEEDVYHIGYFQELQSIALIRDVNPHDCTALIWIYCKENGYLSDNTK